MHQNTLYNTDYKRLKDYLMTKLEKIYQQNNFNPTNNTSLMINKKI